MRYSAALLCASEVSSFQGLMRAIARAKGTSVYLLGGGARGTARLADQLAEGLENQTVFLDVELVKSVVWTSHQDSQLSVGHPKAGAH